MKWLIFTVNLCTLRPVKNTTWIKGLVAGVFLLTGCSPVSDGVSVPVEVRPQERPVELFLRDPLNVGGSPEVHEAVQILDDDGVPQGYRMRLIANICPDQVCEILDVTVYWDLLGHFERLEPSPVRPLTKRNHEHFTPDDYELLSQILRDRTSSLKDLPVAWMVKEPAAGADIDAISGATASEPDVVEGAAYTTWSLWHWVNGDAVEQLRIRTRASETPELMVYWLGRRNSEWILHAIRRLIEQGGGADRLTEEAVFEALKAANFTVAKQILFYLNSSCSDRDLLQLKLAECAASAREVPQREILWFLLDEPHLNRVVPEVLARHLPGMSYEGVDLSLRIFKKFGPVSEQAQNQIRLLTQSGNPFIIRRAKEYLNRLNE